jgi:hypothetical protein
VAVVSDWNLYLERKASLQLGLEASRLADAIARYTLGFNTRTNEVGQRLLRDFAPLHGMSFERAREELVATGLVRFSRGSGGRGNRDTYELVLDEQPPAEERAFASETPAQTPAQTPAPARARKEKGERQDQEHLTGAASAANAASRPPDDDRDAALDDLVNILRDADGKTRETFAHHFGALTADEIDYVQAQVAKRRNGYNGNAPIESDAAYAYELLTNRLNGRNGAAGLPDRWSP